MAELERTSVGLECNCPKCNVHAVLYFTCLRTRAQTFTLAQAPLELLHVAKAQRIVCEGCGSTFSIIVHHIAMAQIVSKDQL